MSAGLPFMSPTGSPVTEADAEALRQMQEESCSLLPDKRSEGDPNFFANGVQIQLHGLVKAKDLNGQTADVIGFDDSVQRYRVTLHSDGTVKVVSKKNLQLIHLPSPEILATELSEPGAPVPPVPSLAQMPTVVSETSIVETPRVMTKTFVQMALKKLQEATSELQLGCQARQERRGGPDSFSDRFLRLVQSADTFAECLEQWQAGGGSDEALEQKGKQALDASEEIQELYFSVRSWSEMGKDEWNLTHHSITTHGLMKTLKNDLVQTGKDVAYIGKRGSEELIGATQEAIPLVRSATASLGTAVQTSSRTVGGATARIVERSHRGAVGMIEDQVVSPLKRAWRLILVAFIMCFLVPLFGLRTYAPLNSVVSNLGLIYALVCLCCPPRGIRRRSAKAALLILYPLFTVALPLGVHFWATHPGETQRFWTGLKGLRGRGTDGDIPLPSQKLPLPLARDAQSASSGSGSAQETVKAPKESNLKKNKKVSVPDPKPLAKIRSEEGRIRSVLASAVEKVLNRQRPAADEAFTGSFRNLRRPGPRHLKVRKPRVNFAELEI
eukprot:TRINITY_DN96326_c0_g1_i1.p1 TRINITY_DN96326_c0_g1~~TRINITY_DN96326_c0_g1_i1.p1  ORF type:complete len:556 (-),score=92.91 TRINITY_DN96326_c0_g1_i1:78-1745(-)